MTQPTSNEAVLAELHELRGAVAALEGTQRVANRLQEDLQKYGRQATEALEAASAAATRAESAETAARDTKQRQRRFRGILAVFGLLIILLGWVAWSQHQTAHRAHQLAQSTQRLAQHLLDDDLTRATSSYTGCSSRNAQIADLTKQTAASTQIVPLFFRLLGDSAVALPAGRLGDVARADFATLTRRVAAIPKPAVQKTTDCTVYLTQAEHLRQQGAREVTP